MEKLRRPEEVDKNINLSLAYLRIEQLLLPLYTYHNCINGEHDLPMVCLLINGKLGHSTGHILFCRIHVGMAEVEIKTIANNSKS